jgi:DNA-binding PadR family transcriptional regulator
LEIGKLTEAFQKEIVQHIIRKLLDIHILILIKAQPMWGYKIKKTIEARSGFKLRHGVLYPHLNILEKGGFITSMKQQDKGRIRKVYKVTRRGMQYLEAYKNVIREQIMEG